MKSFIAALFSFPMFVFAQTVSSDSTVVSTITEVSDKIPTTVSALALLAIGLIAEVIMRVWPTKKPKSFLIMINSGLKAVGSICQKLSNLLDQVIQNLKPDTEDKK